MQLADQAEIIIAVSAADITKNKIRYDLGITYDVDVLRLIHAFTDRGLYVGSVVKMCIRDRVIKEVTPAMISVFTSV